MILETKVIIAFITVVLGVCIAIVLGALWFVRAEEAWKCEGYQEVTSLPTKYVKGTCYVELEPGKWLSWSEVKNRFVATGGAR